MANENVYVVNRNIESLEEIVNEVPEGCTTLRCVDKGLKSLKGIERLPQITILSVYNNRLQSLEFITGSNVTRLYVYSNQIQSLEGLAGSNVTELYITGNQIQSLEGLAGSNVTILNISHNQIQTLEFITGSNVTHLNIYDNPCYNKFVELGESIEKVKEKYSDTLDVKGADWLMGE